MNRHSLRVYSGTTPAEAELQYLGKAKNLELYGVDMHTVLVSESCVFWVEKVHFAMNEEVTYFPLKPISSGTCGGIFR